MKKILLFLSLISLPFSMISNVKAASYASDTLKGKVVTSGDGLYADKYTSGRYVYKGGNPNNFIKFNDELWRIISVEKDGTLKIIRANPLDNPTTKEGQSVTFNDRNSIDYGTYCSKSNYGCNIWAKTEYVDNGISGSTSVQYYSGTVTQDSLLNRYLNNEYYNKLKQTSSCEIVKKDYYFGPVSSNSYENADSLIASERTQVWNGNIALANVSDIVLANTNETTCGTLNDINRNYYSIKNDEKVHDCNVGEYYSIPHREDCYNSCADTNWLMPSKTYKFTDYNYLLLTPSFASTDNISAVSYQGITGQTVNSLYNGDYNNTFTIRPVTYLRSDMEITKGDGSENNPYEFKCAECDGTNNDSKNESNLIVDVPPTSMFISAFIIGGFILIAAICIVIYLKVFKKKDVK